MAQPRGHLQHAPIVEALVDFRVQPRSEATEADFQPLTAELMGEFPARSQIIGVQSTCGSRANQQTPAAVGWLMRSDERAAVAQFRLEGFTFSKLAPYTSWEEVSAEAFRLWQRYATLARPAAVTRLGLRYINQLLLPEADLAEYLTGPPMAVHPIPQHWLEFLTRLVVRDPDRDATAVITRAMATPPAAGQMRILLDIDTFREGPLGLDANLAASFEPLHALKNEIFFASLTEKAIERYK